MVAFFIAVAASALFCLALATTSRRIAPPAVAALGLAIAVLYWFAVTRGAALRHPGAPANVRAALIVLAACAAGLLVVYLRRKSPRVGVTTFAACAVSLIAFFEAAYLLRNG